MTSVSSPEATGARTWFSASSFFGRTARQSRRRGGGRSPCFPSRSLGQPDLSRRWLSARLLRALDEESLTEGFSERPLVGVQKSEFLESQDRYLSLGFARPLVLSPHVTSSVVVGFREEPDLNQVIRFADDPAVPSTTINETCERCPLSAEQCDVRAAEPLVLRELQIKQDRQAAVEKLMTR